MFLWGIWPLNKIECYQKSAAKGYRIKVKKLGAKGTVSISLAVAVSFHHSIMWKTTLFCFSFGQTRKAEENQFTEGERARCLDLVAFTLFVEMVSKYIDLWIHKSWNWESVSGSKNGVSLLTLLSTFHRFLTFAWKTGKCQHVLKHALESCGTILLLLPPSFPPSLLVSLLAVWMSTQTHVPT